MAYLKPQSPIKYKEDHIYPLTTIDQIIMDDGNRLSGVGVYLDQPEEGEETTVSGLNADTLGGILPNDFVLKTDTIENAVNAVEANHTVEADKANLADKAIAADNASKLENKTINELFAMMFEVEHPVGSLYLSMSNTDDPNTKWNVFGINCGWERVTDCFLLGAGDSYALGATGGEAEHTLTVEEMPKHKHGFMALTKQLAEGTRYSRFTPDGSAIDTVINNSGGSQPHNNMPPYIATNIWKRIS